MAVVKCPPSYQERPSPSQNLGAYSLVSVFNKLFEAIINKKVTDQFNSDHDVFDLLRSSMISIRRRHYGVMDSCSE